MTLTADRVREVLSYDEISGELRWKVSPGNQILDGTLAGKYETNGRLRIKIDGKLYLGHRLAWLHYYGSWPEKFIDHINGNPQDNRISNLRQATNQQNSFNQKRPRNNTTGFKGVNFHKRHSLYQAYIKADGKRIHLGYFEDPKEAHVAYVAAAKKYHGEFSRTN